MHTLQGRHTANNVCLSVSQVMVFDYGQWLSVLLCIGSLWLTAELLLSLMAQWVKTLLHKLEDWNSDPQNP